MQVCTTKKACIPTCYYIKFYMVFNFTPRSPLFKKVLVKKLLILIWISLLSGGIFACFWYYDWVYQLPTPVPESYKAVNTGTSIGVPEALGGQAGKPVFLHFFNPDCPCSRFNIKHFKSLVKQYNADANFAIVVMTDKTYTEQNIRDRFGVDLPVSFDTSLAAMCGVYSTPQAVILNTNHQLYYRGNYNKSRYCTDQKTNYAQIALDNLLHGQPGVFSTQYALKAYGCRLPKCTLK